MTNRRDSSCNVFEFQLHFIPAGSISNPQTVAERNLRYIRRHCSDPSRTRPSRIHFDECSKIGHRHSHGMPGRFVSRVHQTGYFCPHHYSRYTANRQPGKALPFYLRLRRATVFDLIREHNLFTDVQDQALLLVEFDHELMEKRKAEGQVVDERHSEAITLLVDHIHSIRVCPCRVLLTAVPGNCWSTDRTRCTTAAKSTVLPLLISRNIV
jgi:hypothetical protein